MRTDRRPAHLARNLAILALLASGCSQPSGPETVPVTGKVEFVKGGSVAKLYDRQAAIEFESVEQPGVKAYGEITEDGSFTMTTAVDAGGKSGVLPGKHRVRLNLDEDTRPLVHPQFCEFESSGITVDLPTADPIVIKIWK